MAKKLNDLICKNTVYITPDKILNPTRNYFNGKIPLDPATEPNNPTNAEYFCTESQILNPPANWRHDGLKTNWCNYDGVFVNPPYGKILPTWCKKINDEAQHELPIIALLPAGPRFSTRYFQQYILTGLLTGICFVKGRVRFLRPDGSLTVGSNPYDSMILGFNVDVDLFAKYFSCLGRTLSVREVQNIDSSGG